jgi:hypothetical protein
MTMTAGSDLVERAREWPAGIPGNRTWCDKDVAAFARDAIAAKLEEVASQARTLAATQDGMGYLLNVEDWLRAEAGRVRSGQ